MSSAGRFQTSSCVASEPRATLSKNDKEKEHEASHVFRAAEWSRCAAGLVGTAWYFLGSSSETRYCSIAMNPDGRDSWSARERAPCNYANIG